MGLEDDEPVTDEFVERQGDLQWREGQPDVGTTPEAVDILRRQGVDAWRAYVAEQEAKEAGSDDQA